MKICQTWPMFDFTKKANIGNTKKMCKICSKLTIKLSERRQRCYFGVFIVNYGPISHTVLENPCLCLNNYMPAWNNICSESTVKALNSC